MIKKFEFLNKNWEFLVNANEKLPTNYKELGHLFIGYCLAKRFQFIFNIEGEAKTEFYKDTNSYLWKYANNINKSLGTRRVDLK